MQMTSGAAKGPISERTNKRSSFTSSSSSSVLDSVGVAYATIASPKFEKRISYARTVAAVSTQLNYNSS